METKKAAPKKAAKKIVDNAVYVEFINLKFLKVDEHKLTDEAEKRLSELEKEIMSCSGAKSKKTVTAHVGSELLKLVEGFPMPKEYEELIKEQGSENYYIA